MREKSETRAYEQSNVRSRTCTWRRERRVQQQGFTDLEDENIAVGMERRKREAGVEYKSREMRSNLNIEEIFSCP